MIDYKDNFVGTILGVMIFIFIVLLFVLVNFVTEQLTSIFSKNKSEVDSHDELTD